ncbi:Glucan endo-1,3-beta-D-glucosidase [Handroanthus impetiginosus]|uniref:Glucan endo-1,3-beta-D-glucosidase n=1 Tax=Handroanthus impetiginosus TaxID=429701 RepID=A0A2G9GK40_9LAMI|nr:Glucan endo-1,3-beta-D-glucosidase [Handroanthus impetiginosus]
MHPSKFWCVVNLAIPADKLQRFLDYACYKFDCREILLGGICFDPDTLLDHANYAIDLVYKAIGVCNHEIGLLTTRDPSYGQCKFP